MRSLGAIDAPSRERASRTLVQGEELPRVIRRPAVPGVDRGDQSSQLGGVPTDL